MTMADHRPCEHQPVQTSAVLVLNATKRPLIPPPSPPTPSLLSPPESACEIPEALDLNTSGNLINKNDEVERKWLSDGLHVLQTEAAALNNLATLYQTDPTARRGFTTAVDAITRQRRLGGRLIIAGVGKSGHIGKKLVATFQSLAIPAVFLHPTEALHGDLGLLGPHDVVMLITFSGKTSELLQLLPHLDEALPLIVLTAHTRQETCAILTHRPDGILLPATIPEPETTSFGVAAPTTSTTAALAVGDALAIAAANELHPSVSSVFAKNHPGGSIGAAFRRRAPQTIRDLAVPWDMMPAVGDDALGVDLLRAGFGAAAGWVRVGEASVVSAGRIRTLGNEQLSQVARLVPGLVVGRAGMIPMASGTRVDQAEVQLRNMWVSSACAPDSVVAVVDEGGIVGVLEATIVLREMKA
ncbi:hypothetical protein V2G26_008623 [Clonostachys chloroleuca]